MPPMGFAQMVALGDRFIAWHTERAQRAGQAAGGITFDADWARFSEHKADLDAVDLDAIRRYVDARLRRTTRQPQVYREQRGVG